MWRACRIASGSCRCWTWCAWYHLFVGVWFDDGTNGSQLLSPDQRVVSAAFAIRARKADSVKDGVITEAMLSSALLNKLLGTTSDNAPSGMVAISAGTFTMGEEDGASDRTPTREVKISKFYIFSDTANPSSFFFIFAFLY